MVSGLLCVHRNAAKPPSGRTMGFDGRSPGQNDVSDSFFEAFPSLLAEFAGRSERLFQRILHVLSDGGLASVDPLCFRDGSAKDGLTARLGVFAVGLIQGDQVKKARRVSTRLAFLCLYLDFT
jgi:hypothetical protein